MSEYDRLAIQDMDECTTKSSGCICLDDMPSKKVDLWSFALSYQHHRMVFDSGALPLGAHTLVFEVTGEKNKEAKSAVVNIDCALIET